ncbi:DivIVA domain-containing protein [Risungbinella massiliensis]|uniref:DivIVA domain-containing protein n=1 Tax=Risungbinella massiliensis TaxID=1329796 RepID=UPI00069AF08A|nr:DivIVA domain-containing protein [Risungbinella massiliensis]
MKRLTPMEIFEKDFKTAMRGYDKEEVNEFLDRIIQSYEDIIQENERLKDELSAMSKGGFKKAPTSAGVAPNSAGVAPAIDLSEYDAVINEMLDRIERLERMVKPR